MFIRDSYSKKKNKKYPCLSLVETYRTPKGPRQRIILTLGNINIPKEQWGTLAEMLERRLAGQQSLVEEPQNLINTAETIIERIRRKGRLKAAEPNPSDVITTDITQIEVEQPRMLGPLLVAEEFWGRLQIEEPLRECGFNDMQIMLTKADVYNRLICPMSENAAVDWIKRTAIEDIAANNRDININKDALYRVTDKLISHKDEIEKSIREEQENLFNLRQEIYLYDTTSTYFEGKADGNDKAKHGHNKDGHPECRQVVVGLVLDKEGFVNRHEVYEGNRQDITTLTDIVDKLRDKIGDKDNTPTVIVDRGMVSEENLKAIKDRGMNYIVAARHTERDKYLLEFEGLPITEIQKATEGKIEVKIKEIGGDIYILCRSDERAEKDKAIKERFFIKIEEMLLRLQRRIESGRLKDTGKIHEQIGKIKQKNQRVARYYEIKVEETNKFIYLKWNKKETDAGITDGIYLLRTNRRDLTEQEIWKLYMMLTKVERAFRHLKSDLGLRPVYHQNGMRVEGHIFVSVLAYHLLHAIEYSLMAKGDRRSWNTIKQILQSHQAVTVVLPDVDNKHVHHVRLATKPDSEQKEIYDRLGIKMTSIKRKRITIKKAEL